MNDQLMAWLALLAGIPAGYVTGTIVHEFGHALAALATGRRVYQITIGKNKLLLKAHLGLAWLYIGRDPVSG